MTNATRRHWIALCAASVVPGSVGRSVIVHNPLSEMKQSERGYRR